MDDAKRIEVLEWKVQRLSEQLSNVRQCLMGIQQAWLEDHGVRFVDGKALMGDKVLGDIPAGLTGTPQTDWGMEDDPSSLTPPTEQD